MLANRLRVLVTKIRPNQVIARSLGGHGHGHGHGHDDHDDHHDHGPMMPAFLPNSPPRRTMPETPELVWEDSNIAPETAIDFDAPHVSGATALSHFVIAFGALFLLYKILEARDYPSRSPVVSRAAVLDMKAERRDLGFDVEDDEESSEHEEEHEEEH